MKAAGESSWPCTSVSLTRRLLPCLKGGRHGRPACKRKQEVFSAIPIDVAHCWCASPFQVLPARKCSCQMPNMQSCQRYLWLSSRVLVWFQACGHGSLATLDLCNQSAAARKDGKQEQQIAQSLIAHVAWVAHAIEKCNFAHQQGQPGTHARSLQNLTRHTRGCRRWSASALRRAAGSRCHDRLSKHDEAGLNRMA